MRKKRYLYQLFVTSVFLLIVPAVLFFAVFFKKSYDEVRQSNTEYYDNITRLFCGSLVNEITRIKEQVGVFGLNNRGGDYEHSIFYEGTKKMGENNYYYAEAAKELQEYGVKNGINTMGIYYYDADFVLCDSLKYSLENFINRGLNVGMSSEHYDKIKEFFSISQGNRGKVVFAPVYDQSGSYRYLLVGVHTELGKNKEKVLIFGQIRQEDSAFFYQSVQGRTWEKYFVIDSLTGDCLYGFGELDEERVVKGFKLEELEKIREEQKTEKNQNLFIVDNDKYNLTFLVDVSDNIEQNIVFRFYNNMRSFLMYIILAMTVMCLVAVYFNYQPVYRLVNKIKGHGKDEFDAILNVWEEQNKNLSEHQEMVLEFLMNRLVHGLPIREKYIQKMTMYETKSLYCVYLIDGYVLDTEEMELVNQRLKGRFGVDLFISDLQGEKSTVIVTFMHHNIGEALSRCLNEWCENNISHTYLLFSGEVVERINDIDQSLKACKEQKKLYLAGKREMENIRESGEQQRQVVQFLEENLLNKDLSRTMLADKFHISVYSVGRICKSVYGVNFSDYVTGKRMEKARELLLETSLPIGEIAVSVGIEDSNYFARMFKQNYGLSPKEFRKENI